MTDHLSINAQRLRDVLAQMRANGVTTALTTDIIDKYMGGFHSNQRVPVNDSWNAQFGKYLKAHGAQFGIAQEASKIPVTVNGHPTTCSRWQLLGSH